MRIGFVNNSRSWWPVLGLIPSNWLPSAAPPGHQQTISKRRENGGLRVKIYPHHIGDFDRATRHLTRLERSIYRDLLDLYYETEQQLSLDLEKLCRRILANTPEERTAVEQALNEFFTRTPTGWYQDRCEEEIGKFRNNQSQKALAGRASAAAREQKRQHALNGDPTPVPNQEPLTNNHKPNGKRAFAPPSQSELESEFSGRVINPVLEATKFLSHYGANGWKVGRNPMKSWKHAVSGWVSRCNEKLQPASPDMLERVQDRSWAS